VELNSSIAPVSETPQGLAAYRRLRAFARCVMDGITKGREAALSPSFEVDRELARIPEISLERILGDRWPEIKLTVGRYRPGMLHSEQAMAVLSILVAEGPKEVLEIGTYMGNTTRQMAENLPTAIIHTVDLPVDYAAEKDEGTGIPKDDFHLIKSRVVGREYLGRPEAARIRQHFGDTATWDFTNAGRPDFFFIDGSHTYEYCKNDSEKCYELCNGCGTFLWHDVDRGHPGVVRFVSEWRSLGRDLMRIEGMPIAYWKGAAVQ